MIIETAVAHQDSFLRMWPLRLKKDEDVSSIIAKFSDPVEIDAAKLPVRMYIKDEEIEEEDTGEVVKDSEYWKNRRKRRSMYRRKSQIILEDTNPRSSSGSSSSGMAGLHFEGRISNVSMADAAETGSSSMALTKNGFALEGAKSAAFKYVLLKVVQKPIVDEITLQTTMATEVNVIPVSDWYQFKKPSLTGQKFLDEIDEDFEQEQRKSKDKLKRYKNLGRALERAERASATWRGGGEGDEGGGDRFDLPAIFGTAATKALRKGGGGGAAGAKKASLESLRLLDENGGDLDEAKALGEDFGKGDYEATRADDDEDVWVEQAENVEQDAVEAGQAVYERSDDEGMGTDDDDDEEDDEGSSDGEGGAGGARSGFVDELVESSAKEFRALHRDADKKRSRDLLSDTGDLSDSASDNGSLSGDGDGIAKKKRARFADDTSKAVPEAGGADGAQPAADTAASAPVAAPAADTTYELSDDGVRRFITNVGGRVRIAEIREVFKQQCKAYAKAQNDKKAGGNRLLDIILRVTKNLEDPLMGTVLVLK